MSTSYSSENMKGSMAYPTIGFEPTKPMTYQRTVKSEKAKT
jgi:hypothetical protein